METQTWKLYGNSKDLEKGPCGGGQFCGEKAVETRWQRKSGL